MRPMRLLHTSDWHLGQHFMGKSRQAEHQALIDWLLTQVEAQHVDAVLIAGDIFDTGTPPSYARELYNQLVVRLHETGVALLILGGNHDSPAMLAESRELLARLGTFVIPSAHEDPASQVLQLNQRNGEPGCLVCAVPYLRPRDILHSQAGQSADDKQHALQQAIEAHYLAVHAAAQAKMVTLKTTHFAQPLPIIATGHLTTVGASESDSVREIYVGSLDAFPTRSFPEVDYIALGHIHRTQKVGGYAHIRYSGSPIPLSFDEAGQEKSVLLVDLDATGLRAVTPLPVPRFQALASLRSTLADLPAKLGQAVGEAHSHPNRQVNKDDSDTLWLEICIEADDYLSDLPARVQACCAEWPVEILSIRRSRSNAAQIERQALETLAELDPNEVFTRRLQQETLPEDQQAALLERYREVIASLHEADSERDKA